MESKNTFSLLATNDDELIFEEGNDTLAFNITNQAKELFFQNFFSIMSKSIEELPFGFFQRTPDDQASFLVQQFGQHAHPTCYDTYAKHTLAPAAFISFIFNLSEKVAIISFAPVASFIEKCLKKIPDTSTNAFEEPQQDNMEITADTNQQSSRIISEETPAPIPDQASSLTPTSKPGNDKSGAKKSNNQSKKGKDTPKAGRKSSDKNSKKITKMIIMKDLPDNLKNNVRDVMLYDIPVEWSPKTILTHLTTWGQVTLMSIKSQRKYCTVRLKIAFNNFTLQAFDRGKWYHRLHNLEVRWFPGRWTLKQRHNRSTFTAKVEGLPVSVATDPILIQDYDKRDSFFKDQGLKAYKFLKQGTDHVTMLGYFENYEDLKTALESPFVYERIEFKWYRTSGRPPKKNSGKNSARSSQKCSNKDSGAQGSPKSSSKPDSSCSVKRNPPSKNKNKKTNNLSLDKTEILKLVLSLLS
ncbi:hypothetical protein RclHR1_01140007 [Rhizophagus clarus]|uniref:Uncharacterized protein n=1 Tax=Rhizophagus clarus TaxID=94130 RepID=A0A2Z6QVY3_9GLOM|nr:hypothetical protein RclHR1_01140007 [Rhizophagus clarus]GES94880.1 hypothetical protein GLOIN_2v1765605 [Rhizophagus clarus]